MMRSVTFLFLLLCITACMVKCAWGGECVLAWDSQPDATSFRVWKGIECIATVSEPQAVVTLPDEPCTVTVTARNANGESAHSAPLQLVAVRIQESSNLKAWWYVRTVHREKRATMFYRLEILP